MEHKQESSHAPAARDRTSQGGRVHATDISGGQETDSHGPITVRFETTPRSARTGMRTLVAMAGAITVLLSLYGLSNAHVFTSRKTEIKHSDTQPNHSRQRVTIPSGRVYKRRIVRHRDHLRSMYHRSNHKVTPAATPTDSYNKSPRLVDQPSFHPSSQKVRINVRGAFNYLGR